MSAQATYRFIAQCRRGGRLAARIAALGADADLEELLRLATQEGFDLTAAELREAYRQDWALRRIATPAAEPSVQPRPSAGATAR
jgi:hypothetical protein